MKRSLLGLVTLALLLFTMALGANVLAAPIPITVGDLIKVSDHSGSNAFIHGGMGGAYWASSAETPKSWDSFITFCLEVDEYIDFSSIFKVGNISDTAQNGGFNTNAGDKLSNFTAWLYTEAVSHSYDDQLDYVQYAIWVEEQEIDIDWLGSKDPDAKIFYENQKEAYASSSWFTSGLGLGNVRVINLMDRTGKYNMQDLLVSVNPVPEPATMLLLGTGLIGIAGFGRKKLLKK